MKTRFRSVIFTLLLAMLGYSAGISQTLITGGTTLKIVPGTSVSSLGHLTLQPAGTLDNQGTLILKQDLVNQNPAPNTLGTGTVVLSGTVSQTISGQNVFGNLTVNNANGITLNGDTRVNSTFNLTNGLVHLGSNDLLLGSLATVAGTPSASNMVVATGSGQLQKEFPAGSAPATFTFPVGSAGATPDYSPVTLNFVSGTFAAGNNAGVNLVDAQYPGTLVNYLNRYWNITQTGISNFSCVASFQYVPSDVTGDETDMYCFRVDPIPFTAFNKANSTAHTLEAHGLTAFSTFTGNRGSTTVPPAIHMVGDVNVSGQSLCFDAQQTLVIAGNGTTFVVQSNGTVNLVAGERILLEPGTLVYAGGYLHGYITQTGQYCQVPSNPIVVNPNEKSKEQPEIAATDQSFRIYPNPTSGKFTVELDESLVSKNLTLGVYGMTGGLILTKEITGVKKYELTLEGRSAGVYFIRIIAEGTVHTGKIILTH
ncbi:MAG: T9SS type A sorting domain-containing protein [Bacteroidales bacterium]|nr:T9SS type A sorting domain-containing protein [Bacteroidales bacterium]